jgi:hypothetical protein
VKNICIMQTCNKDSCSKNGTHNWMSQLRDGGSYLCEFVMPYSTTIKLIGDIEPFLFAIYKHRRRKCKIVVWLKFLQFMIFAAVNDNLFLCLYER